MIVKEGGFFKGKQLKQEGYVSNGATLSSLFTYDAVFRLDPAIPGMLNKSI